jgi:hypothetical protein
MDPTEVKERFLLELPKALRDQVKEVRWEKRLDSESAAFRFLLEYALKSLGKKKQKTS